MMNRSSVTPATYYCNASCCLTMSTAYDDAIAIDQHTTNELRGQFRVSGALNTFFCSEDSHLYLGSHYKNLCLISIVPCL